MRTRRCGGSSRPRTGVGEGHVLRLVVMPDGTAHGRFRGYADYMVMRSQPGAG
ncbi:hypothetical protein [Nonomuraea salmonea]|uniref:Uncharacterized protein n=1 Tax=Nonomuraea salmonea TaxID=46181 RepID=A0ABV5NPI4_9ACTN